MIILSNAQIFSWIALFILIVTDSVCGTVRYFHMCRPYDGREEYYYPSRKWVTFFYLLPLLQIPYLADPFAPDAWIMAKSFNLIYLPTLAATLINSYFSGTVKKSGRFFLVLGLAFLVCLSLFAGIGDDFVHSHKSLLNIGIAVFSLLTLMYLALTIAWLYRLINAFSRGEYSDYESFPLPFAKIVIPVSIILVAMAIVVYCLDSPLIHGFFSLVLAATGLVFLINILHPLKAEGTAVLNDVKESIKDSDLLERTETVLNKNTSSLPAETLDRLERQVRECICEKKMFLNPKFSKTELAKEIGTNRTYLTAVFSERLGSFYSFVNSQRIDYAAEYLRQHPKATQAELAQNSGFGSVKSFVRAKQMIENQ